jgi:hypothetical protein
MSLFDSIASQITANVSSRIPSLGAIGQSLGNSVIGKFVPKSLQGAASRALRGDLAGAVADGLTGFVTGKIAKALKKNPLLGGITLDEARRIAAEVQATQYSKKNLWFLEIEDWKPPSGSKDISHAFNLFATDVAYGPWTITSEAKAVGMAQFDIVTGSERVELRITTYDDTKGTIRKWFDAKCSKIEHQDGTIGLPVDYLITMRVTQSAIDEIGGSLFGSYKETFVVRPSSIDIELSRSDDTLQQLQLVFTQFDTFM